LILTDLEESRSLAKESQDLLKGLKLGLNLKSKLSCKQYVVVYLKIIKGFSFSQVADIMGLNRSTVYTHWERAKDKLTEKV